MKHFLFVYLLALPSMLLAQPTLTFNPANGATDVPVGNTLTIQSDQALSTTSGVNLDDTNVDAFITLVDGNMDPVPFDAVIDGPRTEITITPVTPLAELTNYTLTFQPVENNAGQETSLKTITFQTEDATAPVFNQSYALDNTGTGFKFRVNVNEAATVHYVIDRDATAPSEAEIRANQNGDGVAAEASGSFAVTANTNTDVTISGLDFTPPVKFYIYFFAEE